MRSLDRTRFKTESTLKTSIQSPKKILAYSRRHTEGPEIT